MRAWGMGLILLVLSSSLGCGDDREPMWIDLDRFQRHLASLEHELHRHGQAVDSATRMWDLEAYERSFGAIAREHTDGMAARLTDMMNLCARPDGHEPQLVSLRGALDDLRRGLTMHHSSMTISLSIDAARAEEDRYQAAAPAMFAAARDVVEQVAERAAAYVCKLHN